MAETCTHTQHPQPQQQEEIHHKTTKLNNTQIEIPQPHYKYECRQQDVRPHKRLKVGSTITDLVQKGMKSTKEYKTEKKRKYAQLALDKSRLIEEQEKGTLFEDEKDTLLVTTSILDRLALDTKASKQDRISRNISTLQTFIMEGASPTTTSVSTTSEHGSSCTIPNLTPDRNRKVIDKIDTNTNLHTYPYTTSSQQYLSNAVSHTQPQTPHIHEDDETLFENLIIDCTMKIDLQTILKSSIHAQNEITKLYDVQRNIDIAWTV